MMVTGGAPSWILYRFLHHEECRLGVDVARLYLVLARLGEPRLPLHLMR